MVIENGSLVGKFSGETLFLQIWSIMGENMVMEVVVPFERISTRAVCHVKY